MAIEKVENKNKKTTSPEVEKIPVNKKIELDPNEEIDDDEPIQADFEDETIANKFASQPTKENNDNTNEIDPNTSADEVKNQVEQYESSKSGKLEYKDLKQTAEFLVNLIDTALSTTFKLLARDTSIDSYSMPAPNKKLLVEQLALILAKYQSKFKVEFLFFMGLIVMYAPMAIKCVKVRKLTSKKVPKKEIKEIITETIKTEKDNINLQENEIVEETKKVENVEIPFKRGRGRAKKGI